MPCMSVYTLNGSSWIAAHHRYCSIFEEFLKLSYWSVRSRICTFTYNICHWKYILLQSVLQDQMMLYNGDCWPSRLCRLNRVNKISNSIGNTKVDVLSTDHLSSQEKQDYAKFLWRDNQVDLLPQTFPRFFHSLMMAMIVILRCGDVETNPGPQTSKLSLVSIALCGYHLHNAKLYPITMLLLSRIYAMLR